MRTIARWPIQLAVVLFATLIFAACWTENDPVIGSSEDPGISYSMGSCPPFETPPGAVGSNNESPTSTLGEGEIFGSLFMDGEWDCDAGDHEVTLERVSTGGPASPILESLQPNPAYRIMWEFWDVSAGDACSGDPRQSERKHFEGSDPEGHCVSPGVYLFTGPGRSGPRTFSVDYMGQIQTAYIRDSTPGTTFTRLDVGDTVSVLGYRDLMINTDLGTGTYDDSAVVEIDVVTSISDSTFIDDPNPTGTESSWFRVFVSRSTTTWNPSGNGMAGYVGGRTLAKIFARDSAKGGTWQELTNYYDHSSELGPILRAFQFPVAGCPVTSQTHEIGIDLMRPDEYPSSSPQPESIRYIRVTRTCTSPPSAPSSLGATNITSSGARITWTNGSTASGTTTTVQYRTNGSSTWTNASSSIGTGITHYDLTTLAPDTWYDIQINHTLAGQQSSWASSSNLFKTDTLATPPPPTAPSGVNATAVTHQAATINWTNGTTASGTTTTVEYKKNSSGTWTSASTSIAAGVTSYNLGSVLDASTDYDARVRHSLGGQHSSWATGSFTTDPPPSSPPTVTSFDQNGCTIHTSGPKNYSRWDVSWTVSGSTLGWTWEIWESSSSSFTSSSLRASGSSKPGTIIGDFLMGTTTYRYFRIRYTDGTTHGSWYALESNPIDVGDCQL